MLDFVPTQEELRKLTDGLIELSKDYKKARELYGNAKCELDILLTPKQNSADYRKASYEKQLLMLRHDTMENHRAAIYEHHRNYINQRQIYKGIEKVFLHLGSLRHRDIEFLSVSLC